MARCSIDDVPSNVKKAFEYYARKAKAKGRKRFSATMIINRMRWYTQIESNDPEWKINNNWSRPMAEDLVKRCPEFGGFFEFRDRWDYAPPDACCGINKDYEDIIQWRLGRLGSSTKKREV
jgi:hypothetical protein